MQAHALAHRRQVVERGHRRLDFVADAAHVDHRAAAAPCAPARPAASRSSSVPRPRARPRTARAGPRAPGMRVAQCAGERVGGVRPPARSAAAAGSAPCAATCSLSAAPSPTTASLIARGAYSCAGAPSQQGSAQRRAPRLAQLQRAVGVQVHEHALDRHLVRPVFLHQRSDGIEDLAQPGREFRPAHRDVATGDVALAAAGGAVEDAVAGAPRAGVQPQHPAGGRRRQRHGHRRLPRLRLEGAPGSRGVTGHRSTCRSSSLFE